MNILKNSQSKVYVIYHESSIAHENSIRILSKLSRKEIRYYLPNKIFLTLRVRKARVSSFVKYLHIKLLINTRKKMFELASHEKTAIFFSFFFSLFYSLRNILNKELNGYKNLFYFIFSIYIYAFIIIKRCYRCYRKGDTFFFFFLRTNKI